MDNKDDEEPMEHNWGYARDIYEIDTELTREGWKHYLLDPDDPNRDENKVSAFKEMGYFANLGDYADLPIIPKPKSPHKPKKYAKELRAAGRHGTKSRGRVLDSLEGDRGPSGRSEQAPRGSRTTPPGRVRRPG